VATEPSNSAEPLNGKITVAYFMVEVRDYT